MIRLALLLLVAGCSSGSGNGPGGAALPLEANSLEFGQADLGSLIRQTLEVRNPIGGLPVTVTEVIASSTDLDLADPGFPRTIRPGDRLSIDVFGVSPSLATARLGGVACGSCGAR